MNKSIETYFNNVRNTKYNFKGFCKLFYTFVVIFYTQFPRIYYYIIIIIKYY